MSTPSEKRSRISPTSRCLRDSPPRGSSRMLYLLAFDRRLRDSFSKEIFTGACLEDATRYVDDLRIVLRLDSKRDLADVERETFTWLGLVALGQSQV